MEDIEGIVVHGSPCLPHPVRMWGYRMDTKVTRQGARGKTMVLDEHRFPSGPSSNSPSGARTGACRAPWGYTAPQPPSTEGRSILWCTRFLKQKCIFLVYSQPPCASDTSIVVSILSRHERRRSWCAVRTREISCEGLYKERCAYTDVEISKRIGRSILLSVFRIRLFLPLLKRPVSRIDCISSTEFYIRWIRCIIQSE